MTIGIALGGNYRFMELSIMSKLMLPTISSILCIDRFPDCMLGSPHTFGFRWKKRPAILITTVQWIAVERCVNMIQIKRIPVKSTDT